MPRVLTSRLGYTRNGFTPSAMPRLKKDCFRGHMLSKINWSHFPETPKKEMKLRLEGCVENSS
jgi:hypothetical protein